MYVRLGCFRGYRRFTSDPLSTQSSRRVYFGYLSVEEVSTPLTRFRGVETPATDRLRSRHSSCHRRPGPDVRLHHTFLTYIRPRHFLTHGYHEKSTCFQKWNLTEPVSLTGTLDLRTSLRVAWRIRLDHNDFWVTFFSFPSSIFFWSWLN